MVTYCRALQQASQAHIVVDQNFPEGEMRKVNITGRLDSVERASKMVEELITGEPGSAQAIIQKVRLSRLYYLILFPTLSSGMQKSALSNCDATHTKSVNHVKVSKHAHTGLNVPA